MSALPPRKLTFVGTIAMSVLRRRRILCTAANLIALRCVLVHSAEVDISFCVGDDLTRTSEGNAVFSCWDVGEPAFSFCVGDGGREFRSLQRHISHGYLVNPIAGYWRVRICPCGN